MSIESSRETVFAARVARLGRALSPQLIDATFELCSAHAPGPRTTDCEVLVDVAYGPDPRHRLDVYAPDRPTGPRPILLFVHGGAFVGGDKGAPGVVFYANIGAWAVRSGLVGVNMNYRLAPRAQWPSGSSDVARAVEFLLDNAEYYGGDPARIILVGHSAGAVHVAGYVAGHHGSVVNSEISGAVLISGAYDFARWELSENDRAYFGKHDGDFLAISSVDRLARSSLPLVLATAEFDPPGFQRQMLLAAEARLNNSGHLPPLAFLSGHNHLSGVLMIGSQKVGDLLLAHIRENILR